MNKELMEEIKYEVTILVKSGFYSPFEINEIIEEQFIDENLNLNELDEIVKFELIKHEDNLQKCNFMFFNLLKKSFMDLNKIKIIGIHNAGFDFEEGVQDAMEIYTHLVNNKYDVEGFVFYSFCDIEDCIHDNELFLSFGDYKKNKDLALIIGEKIFKILKSNGLKVSWNHTVDERICIKPFNWMKQFEKNVTYEMEGAVEDYMNTYSED
jgi:hypothetical protein